MRAAVDDVHHWDGHGQVTAAAQVPIQGQLPVARGGVRRNELGDFVNVNQNGKIAMKFEGEDAGDRLIGVGVCTEEQDVLLATRLGRSMRFPVSTVRVFASSSRNGSQRGSSQS